MPKRRVKRHSVTQPSDPSYRFIPLTRGQNAIVDIEDFEWLSQWNWYAHFDPSINSHYAKRHINLGGGKWEEFLMHRVILHCSPGKEIDHKNGNTLDNRKSNLRCCTRDENARNLRKKKANTTGYKGVHFRKGYKWGAKICIGRKQIHLGFFTCPIQAAKAYDSAALAHHGEFAHLNFPIAI